MEYKRKCIFYLILLALILLLAHFLPARAYSVFPEPKEILPATLLRIAQCESWNRQFNASGTILRGDQNKHDIGRFQINTDFHSKKAKQMGIDLYTWEGNTRYALWLYQHEGSRPWNWSKKCWNEN